MNPADRHAKPSGTEGSSGPTSAADWQQPRGKPDQTRLGGAEGSSGPTSVTGRQTAERQTKLDGAEGSSGPDFQTACRKEKFKT